MRTTARKFTALLALTIIASPASAAILIAEEPSGAYLQIGKVMYEASFYNYYSSGGQILSNQGTDNCPSPCAALMAGSKSTNIESGGSTWNIAANMDVASGTFTYLYDQQVQSNSLENSVTSQVHLTVNLTTPYHFLMEYEATGDPQVPIPGWGVFNGGGFFMRGPVTGPLLGRTRGPYPNGRAHLNERPVLMGRYCTLGYLEPGYYTIGVGANGLATAGTVEPRNHRVSAKVQFAATSANLDTQGCPPIVISQVMPREVFTTEPGENEIRVQIEAPPVIQDGDIGISAIEVRRSPEAQRPGTNDSYGCTQPGSILADVFTINTTGRTGRSILVPIDHKPLVAKNDPTCSQPLQIKLQATAGALRSNEFVIIQDERSQIRQEYIDKRRLLPSFARSTPSRENLITAGQFNQLRGSRSVFWSEISGYSDFPGLVVARVDGSIDIVQRIRAAWSLATGGAPVRVTSGWRNPRRNDALPSSDANSFHQSGEAVDVNPGGPGEWPPAVTCGNTTFNLASGGTEAQRTVRAKKALRCVAEQEFNEDYEIVFHGAGFHLHVHIEKQS